MISRINSEHDILLEDSDVDRIIREEKTDYGTQIQKTVREMTRTYVDDLDRIPAMAPSSSSSPIPPGISPVSCSP